MAEEAKSCDLVTVHVIIQSGGSRREQCFNVTVENAPGACIRVAQEFLAGVRRILSREMDEVLALAISLMQGRGGGLHEDFELPQSGDTPLPGDTTESGH